MKDKSRETWFGPLDSGETIALGVDSPATEAVESRAPDDDESRYTGSRTLGEGGIGIVLAVRDARLGREVACKRLQDATNPRTVKRFVREARVTAQLEHPNIVPVHDAGTDDEGRLFYTMKYVRGQSLGDALAETRTLDERLRYVDALVDAVQAMAYAHHRGVLHRDLKPDNIMVGAFGETLVVDWGLARALDDDGARQPTAEVHPGSDSDSEARHSGLADHESIDSQPLDLAGSGATIAGGIAGTPSYMAPEQARGEVLTRATDVFELGAILYQLLVGVPPYTGTPHEALRQAARCGWHRIDSLQPDAPPELVAIAEKALRPRPEDRFPDAAAMLEELEDWRHGRRVGSHDYSSAELLRRFVQQYRLPLAALAAGLVLAVGVGAMGYTSTVRQRDAALAARAETERALARSYQARAEAAARDRTSLEAQLFAAAALSVREDPESRGILAQALDTPGLALDAVVDASELPCPLVLPVGDGRLLCADYAQTGLLGGDGEVVWTAEGGGRITDVSADGFLQVLGDRSVVRRSLVDGRITDRLNSGTHARFRPDGSVWVFARRRIWIENGESREAHPGPSSATVAAYDLPDGGMRVFGVSGQVVDVAADGGSFEVVRGGSEVVYGVWPFPSDVEGERPTWIRAGSELTWWGPDLQEEPLATLDTGHSITSASIRDGVVAATDSGGRTWLWDPRNGSLHGSAQTQDGAGMTAFVDQRVVTSSRKRLAFWRRTPGVPHAVNLGSRSPLASISPSGAHLILCGADGWTARFDLDPMALAWTRTLGSDRHLSCGWVDEETVFVAPSVGVGSHRSAADGSPVADVPIPADARTPFHVEGRPYVVSESGAVLDVQTGEIVQTLAGWNWVIVGSSEGPLVQLESGLVRLEPPNPPVPLKGVDGTLMAREHGFDLVRRDRLLFLHALGDPTPACEIGAFSGAPLLLDGLAAIGRADGRISILKLPEPDRTGCSTVAELRGHRKRVSYFYTRGDALFSTSWDGTIRRWSLAALHASPEAVAARIEATTGFSVVEGGIQVDVDAPAGDAEPR